MKSLYPQGHDVYSNDLQFTEEAREFEDRQRILSLIGDQFGVVSGFTVTDTSNVSDNRVVVSAGLAIDAEGYRLNLVSATTITGILPSDAGSYVAILLANTNIFPTAHPITGASADTREVDGVLATITGNVASGDGWIKLACVSNVVTGAVPSVELTDTLRDCREELRIDPSILGTGSDVAEHRKSAHSPGIAGSSGTSLVPSIVQGATDHITFTDLVIGEWVSVEGILMGTDEVNPVANVMFSTLTDPIGSWNIYFDSSGNTGKTQVALTDSQLLLATVDFDASGDLDNLLDGRVFYEITQDNIRVDLAEAETNDSLTATSTSKNNLNRIRYRLGQLEGTGKVGFVIANSGGDFNGTTDAIFTTAVASLPASGGTLIVADGEWNFSGSVTIDKPISFVGSNNSIINMNTSTSPYTAFTITSDESSFGGIIFHANVTSGITVQHCLDFDGVDHGHVVGCRLHADAGAGTLAGEMVRITGGSKCLEINDTHFESDSGQMYLVRVDDAGNTVSGIILTHNIMGGLGNANLFHLDAGDVTCLVATNNMASLGLVDSGRSWILVDSGSALYAANIAHNLYHSTCAVVLGAPAFITHNGSAGDILIVGNTIGFSDPATAHGVAISLTTTILANIAHNTISTPYTGITVGGDQSIVLGNTILGATNLGVVMGGDYGTIQANSIEGTGSIGISVTGDYNLIDGNTVRGFTDDILLGGTGNWGGENVDKTTNRTVI